MFKVKDMKNEKDENGFNTSMKNFNYSFFFVL